MVLGQIWSYMLFITWFISSRSSEKKIKIVQIFTLKRQRLNVQNLLQLYYKENSHNSYCSCSSSKSKESTVKFHCLTMYRTSSASTNSISPKKSDQKHRILVERELLGKRITLNVVYVEFNRLIAVIEDVFKGEFARIVEFCLHTFNNNGQKSRKMLWETHHSIENDTSFYGECQ